MIDRTSEPATETLKSRDRRGAHLIAVWDGGSTLRPLPDDGVLVIGRGAECDVRIDHRSVSRTHATLRVRPRLALAIEDLGSSNGTRVGGKTLPPHTTTPIVPGDIVEVGAARILFEGQDEGAAEASEDGAPERGDAADVPMDRVERLVELVAPSDISVVLYGETGVGKEVTAEKIHRLSPRAHKPLVRVNCAALSDALLESELFGHERGAFTGAVQSKAGLFEVANGGTVFLDEIAELPPTTQAKLLRVLESRELLRVGGTQPRPFDARFIAASNRDLKAQCDAGAFRFDLYFRLNGITIAIPPLRERTSEIPRLAETLLARLCAKGKRPCPSLTPEALVHLESYAWPGNVRELRNVLERALVLGPGPRIGPEHLPLDEGGPPGSARATAVQTAPAPSTLSTPSTPAADGAAPSLKDQIAAVERQRIVDALTQCGGNQTKAARILGISRRTLLTRLDQWGLPRPRK